MRSVCPHVTDDLAVPPPGDTPADPKVQELIAEEKQHLRKAVRAAETSGPSGVAREAVAHAKEQVHRAVSISHYEQVLDATLRNLELDLLFPEILGRIRSMLEADEATVFLLDQTGKYLYARASVGMEEAVENGLRIPVGKGVAGAVVASRKSQTLYEVNDATVANPGLTAMGIKSLVAVPILVGGDEAVGVLMVGCISGRHIDDQEVRLLEVVAERVGFAIERTRILLEVKVARERAERASKFKTTLLHMASHDIRTPLTAVKLHLGLLKTPGVSDAAKDHALGQVDRGMVRLELLLDDFLDLARAEAGKMALRVGSFDLLDVAKEVVEMFSEQAAKKGVKLNLSGESVVVDGDERRLMQVFVNIVSNAIRYTAEGSVSLKVEHAPHAAKVVLDAAHLVVLDTGQGMTAGQLKRLFQPFTQVHDEAASLEGTGLGLHLAKVIVDAHGGKILVESPGTGKGTSVIVELPVHAPAPKKSVDAVEASLAGDSAQGANLEAPQPSSRPSGNTRSRHRAQRREERVQSEATSVDESRGPG